MLRVYGLTYDYVPNYGSSLQAFALYSVVNYIEIAGEKCEYTLIPANRMKFMLLLKRGVLKNWLLQPMISFHRLQFSGFEKKHMRFVPVSSFDRLPELNETADAFMCGSDVVWNPKFNCDLGAFYLDFAKKYKFSYAASFGTANIREDSLSSVREKLESFDSVSVRESTSADIAERCLGRPVRIVCDPVFLLTQEQWRQYFDSGDRFGNKEYIFVYNVYLNNTIKRFAEKLKQQTGLDVVLTTCGPKQAIRQGILQIKTQPEWLRLLSNARYVVTNSFHATAFSTIFQKDFFTVVEGNKYGSTNMRMSDLCAKLGLEDRILNTVPEEIDLSPVDYSDVQERINGMRDESLAYLRENLSAAYRRKTES